MYTVLITFIDPDDPCRVYHPGDLYPGPGYTPGPDRLARLLADGWLRPPEAQPTAVKQKKKTK